MYPGSAFWNLPGAEYRLEDSGGIVQSTCCTVPVFEKPACCARRAHQRDHRSAIHQRRRRDRARQRTLSLTYGNFAQSGGALIVSVGGRDPGQTGRLSVNGSVSLSGPLTVALTNGFAPTLGEQFVILTCASLSGAFTALDLPPGFTVGYTASSVVLVVTMPPCPRCARPRAGWRLMARASAFRA